MYVSVRSKNGKEAVENAGIRVFKQLKSDLIWLHPQIFANFFEILKQFLFSIERLLHGVSAYVRSPNVK